MSSLIAATLAASALSLLAAGPADARQSNPASEIRHHVSGSFRFVDPGSHHPITVWFCRTSTAALDTRIVFVMHGSDSQTARQACDLASPYLEPLNAIVLAPQFAEQYFPGDAYMFGNMLDAAGNVRPKSAWALTAIERLFDMVREAMGLHRSEYDIVGFSGGAQFVHRLALFVPEARFRRAVAASAGRYAFPSWSEKFPYGLDGSPIDRMQLPKAFARDLVVFTRRSGYHGSRARTRCDGAGNDSVRQGAAILCHGDRRSGCSGCPPPLAAPDCPRGRSFPGVHGASGA